MNLKAPTIKQSQQYRTPSMKPLKDHVSLTLDNDLIEKLRENADIEDRSLSQYINLILKQYLANMNSD